MASTKFISDWIAVRIPWDLEATPLQIKTDSALGSNEWLMVWIYDNESSYIGFVEVFFSSTVQYWILHCTTKTELPVQSSIKVDNSWTITKTETAIIISCNGVEVLNYLFADSSESYCVTKWGGDVVEKIQFSSHGTASDFYKVGKNLNCK